MAQASGVKPKSKPGDTSIFSFQQNAHGLAASLPELKIEANRIAATVAHGIHGRRRAGPGETFWQFRPYEQLDSATLIDWRRSASSDQLYVREREWEAAHTVWLWANTSASMNFKSHLSNTTKHDRALVLMLAAAEMLVNGGERVALLGLTQPSASRYVTTKMAEALLTDAEAERASEPLPPPIALPRFSGTVLFSDCLEPLAVIRERLRILASANVAGHIVQILDPAEETLPYEGRTEFLGPDGTTRWVADRAEGLREQYQRRLKARRAELRELAHHLNWSFMVHHTDRPASEPLLTLITRMQAAQSSYKVTASRSDATDREGRS